MTDRTVDTTKPAEGLALATLGRRSLLRGALAGVTTLALGAPLVGCADSPTPRVAEGPGPSPIGAATATPGASATTMGTPRAAVANGATAVAIAPTPVGSAVGRPAGSATAAAGSAGSPVAAPPARGKVLLAYFSRAGENYYYGGRTRLEVGNTEVLAGMISRRIGCDVRRIEPVEP